MTHNVFLTLTLGTILFLFISILVVMIFIKYQQRQLTYQLEKTQTAHFYEKQILESRLEAQEQSFQHFSEEIHDNVGQLLSVVGMYLYQLEGECTGGRSQYLVKEGSELLNKAIMDLRSISHTFNTHHICEIGLVESIKQEIKYINSVKKVNCSLLVNGDIQEMSPEAQIILFRIVQEAVGNALKHARASMIGITLDFKTTSLVVTIADDGKGFELPMDHRQKGLGLANMTIRANLLGSTLETISTLNTGTTIKLALSLPIIFKNDGK